MNGGMMKEISRRKAVVISVLAAFLIIAALVLFFFILPVFTSHRENEESGKRTLTLYSSLKSAQLEKIESYFERLYPEIDLVFYSSGTGNIIQLLEEANRNGERGCDVIWCAEPYGYLSLIEKGILAPMNLSSYPDLPLFDAGGGNMMAPARLINVGIAVNTTIYDDENAPRSFLDLRECSSLVIPDPYSSGTSLYTVTVLAKEYGWSYFSDLKENGAAVVNGSSASLYAVGTGRYGVTIAPEYLVLSMEAMGMPLKYIAPSDITVTIPSPLASVSGCPNPGDAETFISFILSDSGQAFLYSIDIMPSRGSYASPGTLLFHIPDEENTISSFDRIFIGQSGR